MSATDNPTTGVSAPPTGSAKNGGGGHLQALFPISITTWIDSDLSRAIQLASATEKERQAIIVRRWLRKAAIAEGYYAKG
jgi:hypothetical protein